jgi:hypothetical protein
MATGYCFRHFERDTSPRPTARARREDSPGRPGDPDSMHLPDPFLAAHLRGVVTYGGATFAVAASLVSVGAVVRAEVRRLDTGQVAEHEAAESPILRALADLTAGPVPSPRG